MIRLLQLTDFHVFADRAQRLKGIDTCSSLEKVVQHVLDSEVPFDHVIVTGDHTHDEQAGSYAFVKNQLERLHQQWWQVPGNHDDRTVMRSIFSNLKGTGDDQIRFQFDAESWACIGLDSHVPGQVSGRVEAIQMEWLKQQLLESKADQIAIFLHHPPLDIPSDWMDKIGLDGRHLLADVVKADARIQLIVCGHVHHDCRLQLHQATVLSSPSTSIQFDPAGTTPTLSSDPPGYRWIELTPTGWTTSVVRLPELVGTLEWDE